MRVTFILLVIGLLASCGRQPDPPGEATEPTPTVVGKPEATGAHPLAGDELFVLACQGCHNIAEGAPHRVGPNLYGIAGQPAASREGFNYSPALSEAGITWNTATLTAWVVAAESLVPGTWMLYHNILEPEEVSQLIDYLQEVTNRQN